MLKVSLVTILNLLFCVIISLNAQSVAQTPNTISREINSANILECPVIKTTLGNISGNKQKTVLGNNSFCSYRGIRYGEAPIGKLRFKAPIPSGPWKGTYNASDYGSACTQQSFVPIKFEGSEDCLFLNVFVPEPSICDDSSNIAVIVFIHGGGFVVGAANDDYYGPHLLLNKCVILVTLNYRLAVMGFLPLALPEYSGNMGLKDQQLALEWINQHISAFGGNPKQVTLMGHSSGSGSVSLHRLNSKSRNLFKHAYGMSGSALNSYAMSNSNNKTDLIVDLAKNQGVVIENSEQLIDYLQKVDAYYIVNQTSQSNIVSYMTPTVAWQPCIELKTANNPFLTEDPQILLSKGVDVPSVYTYTSLEAICDTPDVMANPDIINYLEKNFTFPLPFNGLDQNACKEEIAPIFSKIRRFYFGQATINASQLLAYTQLTSYTTSYFIHKEVALQALSKSNAEIRLLRINMRTALTITLFNHSSEVAALAGTGHGDEICSYFWCGEYSHIYNEIEPQETLLQKSTVKASEILREILTNFANTGNPVSETASFHSFPVVNSEPLTNLPFTELLSISTLASGSNPDHEEFKFWWAIDQKVEEIKKMPCNQK